MKAKGLNSEQLRYARGRLHAIEYAQRKKIEEGFFIKDATPPITFKQLYDGIAAGSIKLRSKSLGGGYERKKQHARNVTENTLAHDIFEFIVPSAHRKRDEKAYAAASAAHSKKWTVIWDKIMLSSAEDALAVILEQEKAS